MQTEKTDQTGQMPRLIWVFAGRIGLFVSFVMRWLVLVMHWYYCVIEFIKLVGENRSDALHDLIFPQTCFIYLIIHEHSYVQDLQYKLLLSWVQLRGTII